MKKILCSLAAAAFIMAGCSSSPQSKAEALIKEEMPKNLIKPDSYDPVRTKVDSAFAPADSPELLKEIGETGRMAAKVDQCLYNINMLKKEMSLQKSYMAVHSDNLYSRFSKNEYNEARSNYKNAEKQLDTYRSLLRLMSGQFKGHIDKTERLMNADREFIGYRATHRYRSDDNEGNTTLSEYCILMDKDLSRIIYTVPLEDYESYLSELDGLKEHLEFTMQIITSALEDK